MLAIFPPHGLDQTIHVAVLLGVLLMLLFTEWFGWVSTGLVVPGYLASVLVIDPAAAAAIVMEGTATYALAACSPSRCRAPGHGAPFSVASASCCSF